MRTVECSVCGAPAKIARGRYAFAECGLHHVVLEGIDLIRCRKCKNVDPIIPRANELMRVLAFAVVRKPCGLVGQEVRFLRKYLGMTGEEFGALLHVDKTTLSKWENGEDPVGGQSDRLIRLMALNLSKELNPWLVYLDDLRELFSQVKAARINLSLRINPTEMSYAFAGNLPFSSWRLDPKARRAEQRDAPALAPAP